MKDSVIKLHSHNQRDAKDVLQQAIDLELETVVIVGVAKDNSVHLVKSFTESTLYLMGCLSAMKAHVFENWE